MAKTIAPYGSWRSPYDVELLAGAGNSYQVTIVDLDDDGVYWLEPRAAEGGRAALMLTRGDGTRTELTPPGFNARTRVHEYGGGAAWRDDETFYASSFEDGRVYRLSDGSPVTPQPTEPNALRYADGVVTQDGTTICVRESHGEAVVNELVAFPADGSADPWVIASGRDFYMAPRVSPDGERLAFLAWDHPLLPFIGCELWTARVDGSEAQHVAGGADESIFQPEWSPDGTLHWVSDRDNWWNLYRDGEQLTSLEAELGYPQWAFGLRTYGFLENGRIAATVVERAVHSYVLVDPATGGVERLDLPFTASMPHLCTHGNRFAVLAGSPRRPPGIVRVDADSGEFETLSETFEHDVDPGSVSVGRPIEFETSDGGTAHAFYYPPANADFTGPDDELPPLRVLIHGGPTSQAWLSWILPIQGLTSRGWAVIDVNYRGSTGFGRAYREQLHERWGEVDLDDCIAAARHLADAGEVDPRRLSISGGSAGGYTTLLALAMSDVFAAGYSAYGVADLVSLAETTHKFEERYLDWLVGPLPEALDRYRERSPITHADDIRAPVLIAQGLDDEVVPPSQAEQIVEALRRNGVPYVYVPLEGEGHGFRRKESRARLLRTEWGFFGGVFGFTPADDVEPVEIAGLDSARWASRS
jgi:dipeptidyl aminopeptidase/acylaminoacyl peptidase